jgi:glycosyltransferase involved in cell wall biosynthesis
MREGTDNVAVGLCFKDFSYWSGYSSVGLNVAARLTAEELRRHGISSYVMGVKNNVELLDSIFWVNGKRAEEGLGPLTNVVILAPWITPLDLKALLDYFPSMEFTVQSHCNVAALYGDYRGIGNLRNYADLMNDYPNLSLAGNALPFVQWFAEAYGVNVYLLPDLYPIREHHEHEKKENDIGAAGEFGNELRIGAFGALRPEKNIPSACAAAILIQERLGVPVSLHINQGGERSGREILATIDQMSQGIPGFDVVKHKWMPWEEFNRLVRTMDLLIQPSFTESFNIVTADGVANRIPSVVSSAVRWAPDSWKANPDNPDSIASVGLRLLADPMAWKEGRDTLVLHNKRGVRLWKGFLYDDDLGDTTPPDPDKPEPTWTDRFFRVIRNLWPW